MKVEEIAKQWIPELKEKLVEKPSFVVLLCNRGLIVFLLEQCGNELKKFMEKENLLENYNTEIKNKYEIEKDSPSAKNIDYLKGNFEYLVKFIDVGKKQEEITLIEYWLGVIDFVFRQVEDTITAKQRAEYYKAEKELVKKILEKLDNIIAEKTK